MDFASDMVYEYQHSSDECISEAELEGGMYQSCSESSSSDDESGPLAAAPPPAPAAVPQRASQTGFLSGIFSRSATTVAPAERTSTKSDSIFRRKKKKHQVVQFEKQMRPGANLREELRRRRRNRVRRADTNIVSVKFNQLIEPSHMHTGDVVRCAECDAVLSHLTKPEEKDGAKTWHCEFCGHGNKVDIEQEEIPAEADVTFMLVPASATTTAQATADGGPADSSMIVFCVDISGSMCVTTEVPGKFQLRGADRTRAPQSLNEEREDQYFPGQRRNVTYVSRLQAMQAAVDHQLEEMKKKYPERRVALVSFNNEVCIVGDGKSLPVVLSGDKLNDWDRLVAIGNESAKPGAIKDTAKGLSEKLFALEEGGATSLGPALLVSIALAGQVAGSKVIICTDGMANVGLGSLENIDVADDLERAQEFYTKCGKTAAEKGVCVSILTIAGNECRTMELGIVANETSGAVDSVDPLSLTQQFGSILANPIIATNVTATILLHQRLYVREDDDHLLSRVARHVGNVTADSEITFEYGVRTTTREKTTASPDDKSTPAQEGEKKEEDGATADAGSAKPVPPPLMLDGVESLPFQLQLTYTSREGAQSLRVVTMTKPVTRVREEAERHVNVAVLGAHQAQRSAQLAMEGDFTRARSSALGQQRLVSNYCRKSNQRETYDRWFKNMHGIDQELLQAQRRERVTMGRSYSDDEDDEMEAFVTPMLQSSSASMDLDVALKSRAPRAHAAPKKKGKARRKECQDSSANFLWKMKTASTNMFT